MNSTQINCFLTVASLESISKAADKLFVSQPAVSRHIASLEKEWNVELFRHVGRNIVLTECGRRVYALLTQFWEDLSRTLDAYQTPTSELSGTLQLGYISNWSLINLAGRITHLFEQKYEKIHLAFRPSGMQQIVRGLKWNEMDAALTMESALPSDENFAIYQITNIQSMLLYSENHPVAKCKATPLPEDFRDSVFYSLSDTEAADMQMHIRRYCEGYGFMPNIQLKDTWQTCLALVYSGSGVVITDEWAPEVFSPQFCTVPLSETHSIVLAWKKSNKNPCIPVLKRELRHLFSQASTIE